ncbi:MAG: alpha/beta hydrolase [Kordiimonas sp.]
MTQLKKTVRIIIGSLGLIVFLFTVNTVSAQSLVTIPDTVQHELQSTAVEQNYILQVALPRKYGKTDKQYPVVYLLDANADFPLVTSIARRLQAEDDLQEFLIVGISYPENHWGNRRRDYTPTHYSAVENSGGGPNFAKALKTEIIPFIEGKYRAAKTSRSLIGHSLGGLFGAYMALNGSGLFDNFIISSPSLWWDNTVLLKTYKQTTLAGRPSLFITVGADENPHMVKAWRDLHTFTSQKKNVARQKAISLNGENHASAKFRAYADGLRWLFGKN